MNKIKGVFLGNLPCCGCCVAAASRLVAGATFSTVSVGAVALLLRDCTKLRCPEVKFGVAVWNAKLHVLRSFVPCRGVMQQTKALLCRWCRVDLIH